MFAAVVSLGSWFKLAETVLASFAMFIAACWTADTDGVSESDGGFEAAAAFAALIFDEEEDDLASDEVDAFSFEVEDEESFVVVVEPDAAFAPLDDEPEDVDSFVVEDVSSLSSSDAVLAAPLVVVEVETLQLVDSPELCEVASLFKLSIGDNILTVSEFSVLLKSKL